MDRCRITNRGSLIRNVDPLGKDRCAKGQELETLVWELLAGQRRVPAHFPRHER